MVSAVLFDLDDTLLANPMDTFVPAYFSALGHFMARWIDPDHLVSELIRGTEAMDAHDSWSLTNEEAFASAFYGAVGCDEEKLKPRFEDFYAREFPRLRVLTKPLPEARSLVAWVKRSGLQLAVATNPLFPRNPIEQRLEWAGVAASEFGYDLITSYEVMHATKASPAYYEETARLLGRDPGDCLMIGDDWCLDIMPAATVGMRVYWVTTEDGTPTGSPGLLAGQGTLSQLWDRVQVDGLGWLDSC